MRMPAGGLLRWTAAGLYCPQGDFYLDPLKPVERALITHAHADHLRPRMGAYWCSASSEALLRIRVGTAASITPLPYGRFFQLGSVRLSFHPAGHILGSAQVRMEADSEVWVYTGDHNANHVHGAAEPFEVVTCDVLITESTFALPVYRWPDPCAVMADLDRWWQTNQEMGYTSVIPAYPLGKSQRILHALICQRGPIAVLGSAKDFLPQYRAAGVTLPQTSGFGSAEREHLKGKGLVICPAAAELPATLSELQPLSFASVSGWMQLRGRRRQTDADRCFVLSDHSDWDALLKVVRASGARRVGVTHGQVETFARYLSEVEQVESFVVPA